MAGPFKARQIIEEDQFEREKKQISKSVERLDEILFGVTWAISRAPESFPNVTDTKLYLAKTDAGPARSNIPGLYIWFKFDDEEVHLLGIEVALDSL